MADETETMKVPPSSLEAEQSVLGSMILDRDQIAIVVEMIGKEHFYKESNGRIFEAIVELFEKGEPVDIVTLIESLSASGILEKIGGAAYITSLIETVPTPSNARTYARIVEEKAILRQLIQAGNKIVNWGYQCDGEVDEIVSVAEKTVYDVAHKRAFSQIIHIRDAVKKTYELLDQRYKDRGIVSGLPTGFADLDQLTSGFHPSDFIVLAARPSMGKTSLGLNVAQFLAIEESKPVGIVTLEMSAAQLVTRMLCSIARVDASSMRKGFLMEKDWERIAHGMDVLSKAPIFIVDTPGITTLELRAKARRMQMEHGVEFILVDYLQLLSSRQRRDSKVQEVSDISRDLKLIARELNIPVLVISQLSRAVEQRQEKRPQLSDLRESGAIEQDADVVIFIYRKHYYDQLLKDDDEEPETQKEDVAEISVAKQRSGPTGRIRLTFLRQYTRFESYEGLAESYD
ncbi:MAG: replicative DNA helicase [bacterium]